MSVIQKVNFEGLDTDTDVHSDKWIPGSYTYALNVHVGSSDGANVGTVEYVKGNSLVSFSLPAGTNKVIGSFEDISDQSVYYFLYNSNSDHGIYKYNSNTNSISKIIEWSGFNFDPTKRITGVGKIDRMLGWTDNNNPPRAIDLTKIATYATLNLSEEFISLIKRPPNYPPLITLKTDGGYPDNFIKKRFFQFRTMFVYEDNSNSTWSPISQLAINKLTYSVLTIQVFDRGHYSPITTYVTNPDSSNYIELDLNISELLASDRVNMVKKILVAVREGNTGKFGVFKTLTRAQFTAISGNIVNFYNDETLNTISDLADLKLFDVVPLKSAGMTAAKSRFFLGNNVVGYDKPSTVAVAITPTYNVFTPSFLGKMFFKKRGVYKFGLVYFDDFNRSTFVENDDTWTFKCTGDYCNNVNLVLSGTPPLEAKYYQPVRTEDLRHGFFLGLNIHDPDGSGVQYLTGYDGSTGDAVYSRLYNEANIETHLAFDAGSFANIAYNYTEGDRIYIEYRATNGATKNVDLPVKAFFTGSTKAATENIRLGRTHIGSDNNAKTAGANEIYQQVGVTRIVVENFNFQSGVATYAEVYTPSVKTGTYYEIGQVYPIDNPGTLTRAFSQPSINIDRGDIFVISRKIRKETLLIGPGPTFQTYVYRIVMESVSQFDENYETKTNDIGRINIINEDEKQDIRITGLSYSNPYIQDSQINGVSTFDSGDAEILPIEHGEITKLQIASNNQSNGNVMLAVHKNEISTVYIGEAVLTDNRGQEFLAKTDKVIGTIRPLSGGVGSVNPESVVQYNGKVWGWDVNKGIVWRYAADGITPISDALMKNYFYNKSRTLLPLTGVTANAVYDQYFNEYIICFNTGTSTETIAFSENENKKRWTTFYSFAPEAFQKVNTRVVSFVNGALWLHGANSLYNNFYGIQYTSQIEPVCNIEPSKEKILLNVGAESKDLWVAIDITTPEGQQTSLAAGDYVRLANVYSANVLRDQNTVNIISPKIPILHGDLMRSMSFKILMEGSNTSKSNLKYANFKVIPSERSNT